MSRIENLQEAFFSLEQPPLRSQIAKFDNIPKEFKEILLSDYYSKHYVEAQPSFGYPSLNDELKGLIPKIDISSSKLTTQFPRFVFGRLSIQEPSRCQLEVQQQRV